jgi:hypothetical protein
MSIRKPRRGSEEERVYRWWWGGSLLGSPKPDETTWLLINTTYDFHKMKRHSEAEIHELARIEPGKYLGYGMAQLEQWVAVQKNPQEREAQNAELRAG